MRKWLLYIWPVLWLAALSASAGTLYWSDNFDTNGTSRWMLRQGIYGSGGATWQIRSPTAGPATNATGYRAHSGSFCANTQNYGINQDARLICTNYSYADVANSPTLLVPGDHPRLRFWHWFNLGSAEGYVEVSVNQGANWIQVSPTYYTNTTDTFITDGVNGGGVWSRPSIDLSAFAGQNIWIAFHFASGSYADNGLGWFVDDVELDTGTPSLSWPEGFESNPNTNDWSVDLGTWVIGTPTTGPPVNTNGYRTHSGAQCAGTVLTANYGSVADTRLISPPFTVPTTGDQTLYFWQWYDFNNAQGFVEISNGTNNSYSHTNTIITTNTTTTLNTNSYQFFGTAFTGYTTTFYWNPTIGGWTNATKAFGFVPDTFNGFYPPDAPEYLYEAGPKPLATVGQPNGAGENVDFRPNPNANSSILLPSSQPAAVSNYLALQGMTWTNTSSSSISEVGYFGTNYAYTYSTNSIVTSYSSSWTAISATNFNVSSGTWTNTGLDLSAYAGQTVQIAFHFQSTVYYAKGWYIDDLSFVAAPTVSVPGTQTLNAGQTLTITNISATNNLAPNATYTFSLVPPYSTNYWITTNGVLTWTNTGIVNGVLNWTNSSVAPGTNTIFVKATDNSSPPLSATNSISVVILPPLPPTLTVPVTQTIQNGQTLQVTNFATNTNLPGSLFTFSLPSPSTNYWITANGVLTWTNTAAAPGVNPVTVVVTDNSIPPLTATGQFNIIVAPPPVLLVPAAPALHAGQTLALAIGATNTFLPASQFTFSLPAPSTNYWLATNGMLTWTNTGVISNRLYWATSSVAPGTNAISVIVTDNSTPPMSASSNFNLVILPPLPPTVLVPANQTIYAGQTLVVTNSATNGVLPKCAFTFAASGPANLDVSNLATNGVLKWVTTTTMPVGTYTNTVWVVDNSVPPLFATNSFVVTVASPPSPTLSIPNQYIYAGQTMRVVCAATNSAFPAAIYTYTYRVANNVPVNLDVSQFAAHGILQWTPTTQSPDTITINILATDNHVPPLSAGASFDVLVYLPPSPELTPAAQAFSATSGFAFTLNTVANSLWRIEASTNLIIWQPVFTNVSDDTGRLQVTDPATNLPRRFYRAVTP
jgi:hypothetical protein